MSVKYVAIDIPVCVRMCVSYYGLLWQKSRVKTGRAAWTRSSVSNYKLFTIVMTKVRRIKFAGCRYHWVKMRMYWKPIEYWISAWGFQRFENYLAWYEKKMYHPPKPSGMCWFLSREMEIYSCSSAQTLLVPKSDAIQVNTFISNVMLSYLRWVLIEL